MRVTLTRGNGPYLLILLLIVLLEPERVTVGRRIVAKSAGEEEEGNQVWVTLKEDNPE